MLNQGNQLKRRQPALCASFLTMAALTILFSLPQSAAGQGEWTTAPNGTDIYKTINGRVGIGTTTPATDLEVSAAAPLISITHGNGTNDNGELVYRSAGNYKWGMINYSNAHASTSVQNALTFYQFTDKNNAAVNQYRMVINDAGNVGIGTLTPAARLAVVTNTASSTSTFTITPDGTNNYYASNNHDALFIDGSQTSPHGLYTSAVFRLLHIKASTGFDTLSVGRGGDMVVSPETRLASYALKLAPDASNSYYAGVDYDILQVSGVGLNNHGIYTNKTVRLIHVTNAAGNDAFVMSREGNATFGGDVTVAGNIAAKYQDVAEWVPVRAPMSAGTVVVLDTTQSNQVQASFKAYDTRVAGVISAQPGVALGVGGEGKALVATTGRVKVKVDATRAAIGVGDLLVTGEPEGMAMKSEPLDLGGTQIHRPGTLIGKALEPLEKGKTGEILVLLSLQ
jgi:hypothetical protein